MMWFVFLAIFLGVTTAQRNHFQQSFQQRHCRHVQQAYSDAYQQCKILGELDATVPQVGADDIGTIFFFQGANPPDAQIDYNRTTTLLMAEKLFKSHNEPTSCIPIENRCSTIPLEKPPKDDRYRTITGAHNNRKHPKWGKSFTPYGHILTPVYDDGISEIRKSVVGGKDLPGARIATNAINQDPFVATPEFPANHMSVMFGQLMAHDHGMRLMYQSAQGGATRTCCNKDYTKPLSPQPHACYAIEYPENDPYLKEAAPDCKYRCMNYIRSQPTFPNDCGFGPFGAVNQVSHYIDLSPVYGNTVEIANELRTFHDGLLKNNKNKVLPETCDDPTIDCYLTGDFRGTGIFFLGILQSMYHRFHNIVAVQLKALNPKWNDERIYQETRRVVIACYQNHVIDWLRVFSGNKETKRFRPVGNNYVGRYNANIDASSTAEFSHAVFRVYHSNLADKVKVMNANNEVTRIVNLDDNDIGLKPLETEYDDIARGMLATGAGHASFTPTVRNKMFNNDNKFNLGLDLISTDLFIGRDLGVQPYYVYFQKCLGKKVRSWDDLKLTIPAKAIDDLKGVYKSVHDVDAYAGLALEAKNGSYIGEVGKCLIVSQYIRTTTGDRYFYNLPDGAYPFTKQQLEKIYKFSFSNFVCTVTNLAQVPASGFEFPISGKNDWVACQRGIDLSPWKGLR